MNRHGLPLQLKEGLVLWYPSYPGSGTTVYDASGYGNNGTLVNTPTKVRRQGYDGFNLVGTSSQRISAPSISTSDFTVSIVASLASYSTQYAIFTKYSVDSTPNTSWWIDTYPSNVIRFGIWGSGGPDTISSTFAPVAERLYHMVGVYSSGSIKLYVNGALNNSKSTSIVPNSNSTGILVGAFNGATPGFHATMKGYNPMLWNRALSATEIQLLHKAFFIP